MVQMMTLYRYFEADQMAKKTQGAMMKLAANEVGKV